MDPEGPKTYGSYGSGSATLVRAVLEIVAQQKPSSITVVYLFEYTVRLQVYIEPI